MYKTFVVPVEWAMSGFLKVQAASIDSAIQQVKDGDECTNIALPIDGNKALYIEDSFMIANYDDDELADICTELTEAYEQGQIETLN